MHVDGGEKKIVCLLIGEKKIQEYLMCENRTPVMLLRIMKSRVLSTVCVTVQVKLPEAVLISLANFS